jgi:hypothetical protein
VAFFTLLLLAAVVETHEPVLHVVLDEVSMGMGLRLYLGSGF